MTQPPRPPGPAWLGTAVLAIAVVEMLAGIGSLVVGVKWVGILLLTCGLMIATLSVGMRTMR